jgi:hypothetical protein
LVCGLPAARLGDLPECQMTPITDEEELLKGFEPRAQPLKEELGRASPGDDAGRDGIDGCSATGAGLRTSLTDRPPTLARHEPAG